MAEFDAMLALDGVFLMDGAGDLVGFSTSDAGPDSALAGRLLLAFAAASVDLGCRIALAALDALADLADLAAEACGMTNGDWDAVGVLWLKLRNGL